MQYAGQHVADSLRAQGLIIHLPLPPLIFYDNMHILSFVKAAPQSLILRIKNCQFAEYTLVLKQQQGLNYTQFAPPRGRRRPVLLAAQRRDMKEWRQAVHGEDAAGQQTHPKHSVHELIAANGLEAVETVADCAASGTGKDRRKSNHRATHSRDCCCCMGRRRRCYCSAGRTCKSRLEWRVAASLKGANPQELDTELCG